MEKKKVNFAEGSIEMLATKLHFGIKKNFNLVINN